MKTIHPWAAALAILFSVHTLHGQDWPQWCGSKRDARVAGFNVPKTWPKELTEKWKVSVGDGVATPALVGERLYVFSREKGNEVVRCLSASDGKEIWKDQYETAGVGGPASGFAGPRSCPAVVDNKVITLGVHGILTCYDAEKGTKLWRNEDFKGNEPPFAISSSPLIVDGLVIVQFGGQRGGGIAALELATGKVKWKWTGDGAAYASPTIVTIDKEPIIIAETAKKIVAVDVKEGKLKWETPFAIVGRGYNAASPMTDGQTLIYAGSNRGTTAVKLEKKNDQLAATNLWANKDNSVVYNTPIIKDGMVFGLSDKDTLFCINPDGKTAWTHSIAGAKGGRGRAGYGNIVDAGSVLMAITPSGALTVFEPSDKEFKEVANYKVSSGGTYAYPILSGNRIFVKDSNSLILFTLGQ